MSEQKVSDPTMSDENEAMSDEAGMELDPGADVAAAAPSELDKAKEDLAKAKDALLRTAADFDNYRKRQRREMDEMKKFATEKVLLDLLPALDNLQRALAASAQAKDPSSLLQGVKMVADQFRSALEGHGLKGFESVGQSFDPTKHEAISEREDGEAKAGTVVEEFQRGYMLHERVARPAMVVVAKGAAAPEAPSTDESLN
jgi:molecular chaperone GrpE